VEKFQNKYRIPSNRLKNWDYGSNAVYYVTLCTKNRECWFGKVIKDEMVLSEIGQVVKMEWIKTPEIRPDMNLQLGEFMVMPNHFHAIIFIGKNKYNTIKLSNFIDVNNCRDTMHRRDAMHRVSTIDHIPAMYVPNTFGPQSKNLGSIIRGFKSSVTTFALKCHSRFEWQPRFYDSIIRNFESYEFISDYIVTNPANWKEDEFYPSPA
jgi:putative transposase